MKYVRLRWFGSYTTLIFPCVDNHYSFLIISKYILVNFNNERI